MGTATSLAVLDRDRMVLSDEERLRFLDEFVVAASLGWDQVMGVLHSYIRDPETLQTLERLDALKGLLAA
jgi:hypothetical protein